MTLFSSMTGRIFSKLFTNSFLFFSVFKEDESTNGNSIILISILLHCNTSFFNNFKLFSNSKLETPKSLLCIK